MAARAQRLVAAAGLIFLLAGVVVVTVHQATDLGPGLGRRPSAVADTGHAERGGSAHLDPLEIKRSHECLVCWLGHLGLATSARALLVPRPAEGRLASLTTPDLLADLGGAGSARAPPLG